MSDRRQRRFAVFHVTVAEDFNPQRPWNVPEVLERGDLFAKNLSLEDAQGYARTFNKNQLESRRDDPANLWPWALVVRIPHYRSDAQDEPAGGDGPAREDLVHDPWTLTYLLATVRRLNSAMRSVNLDADRITELVQALQEKRPRPGRGR